MSPIGPQTPHRGVLILVLGILGLTACCFCSPVAWWMGEVDLSEIRRGTMDREGESLTQIGRILGIVGTALPALGFVFYFVILLVA